MKANPNAQKAFLLVSVPAFIRGHSIRKELLFHKKSHYFLLIIDTSIHISKFEVCAAFLKADREEECRKQWDKLFSF